MIFKKLFKKNSQKLFKNFFMKIIQKSYLFDKFNRFDEKFNHDKNEKIVVVKSFVFNTMKNYEKMSDAKKIQFVDILNW